MREYLTQKEAAEYLKMKEGTFRNYSSKGFFTYYRHYETGTKRFITEDLDAGMERIPAKKRIETPLKAIQGPKNTGKGGAY